ncbi:hypothetical protein KQI61_04455 [Anaerocolumna aminovalerica]|uniref:RNase H family protein n=1 Tax=Anaerocolumna aminovalerica TaxID=1527 RepID=UPI001C0EE2F4|nr:RNase H family protein [Anaerocolumna aminovalerica]MBU5331439.1 hypothetical protein [Anaerocolumna aminovalerica]
MKVSVYINTYHKGRLKTGTGTYGIILEYIKPNGEPETREYFKGLSCTTKNRTALTACIEALSYLTKPCTVNITINNRYLTEIMVNGYFYKWNFDSWTNGNKPVKNPDLWFRLFEQLKIHKVNFSFVEVNQYTNCIETMFKRIEIEYKEDRHV